MIDYKKLGIKNFKKSKFEDAMTYFSLGYAQTKDESLLYLIQLCSLASERPDEAKMLFEYFMGKDILGKTNENFDEILEVLESKIEPDFDIEEQDAISYEDFMEAVWREGNFKKVFENIMFSTKVIISNKDDFLDFLENLIKNNFLEMSMNYLESATVMFGGDERIGALLKEIQKRQDNENFSSK
ncbi:histidine kinase [Campylobacter sp. RM9344]|uniref:Histidine kinase n=1 Tax=Campylobacter californiensis TaxID=1032243 RepID=A0AAW3ZYH5_9BACT|nr:MULTISPECIES: histidine kinase [unclassified Campylobacter]MBE2985209.1 histidine kinase [Campylobacter sp. RM6883]MBE2986965.1 histidine kinase [Campylobacter sp. RM12919]MBE2988610.1 histidine kinase [Campylobacter sp. RM12920]MBE2995286.1 histidine kinase [Campylobacter sp. RM6913]MBE3029928.1 histidine kinase [Campylobacter sp. RM9344]